MIFVGVVASYVTIPERLNKKCMPIRLNSTPINRNTFTDIVEEMNSSAEDQSSDSSCSYQELTYMEFFRHP
jgi:hypothetical protein